MVFLYQENGQGENSMSKNINISITLKELTVLEHFVQHKYLKPNNGISAMILLDDVNEEIKASNEALGEEAGIDGDELISRTVLYRMLKKFKEHEIISDGIKIGKTKTLYITPRGVLFYASLVDLSQDNTDQLVQAYEQINGKWGTVFDSKVR